ncbi:MAG TPA: hypothetical protein VJ251_09310, partial [Stellaceae bacterium]|nr:hypothetical protein [Stellaceae bacterium]
SRRGDSRGGTVAEDAQTQLLVEAWIPAFAGTAREEAHIKIVTMLADTNWITASKAGIQDWQRLSGCPGPAGEGHGLNPPHLNEWGEDDR